MYEETSENISHMSVNTLTILYWNERKEKKRREKKTNQQKYENKIIIIQNKEEKFRFSGTRKWLNWFKLVDLILLLMWRKVAKSETMDSFDQFKRMYAIKRYVKWFWFFFFWLIAKKERNKISPWIKEVCAHIEWLLNCRLKILWIIVGLICMVFLLYGVDDRTNTKSTTADHNYGSTFRLADYESNLGKLCKTTL